MTSELVYIHAGFGADAVPYLTGWELQRRLHEQRVSGEIPDVCLLLEHQAVYTAGKRTSPLDRPVGDPGAPVIDVDRGGQITWHGPGQIVRVSRGVTMHGFALNCDPDLGWYDRIVACGIRDAGVTSLSAEMGRQIGVADMTEPVERHLAEVLGARDVSRARASVVA